MKNNIKYVIITPVRDEEKYIEKTIISVINQTILPNEWLIVNDNSIDNTVKIINNYKDNYKFINIIDYPFNKDRIPGKGVIQAFNFGYSKLYTKEYDFIVKLDADLSFDSCLFENIFNEFEKEGDLGLASGLVVDAATRKPVTNSYIEYTYGACKIYKKECFTRIIPIEAIKGWDMLDNLKIQQLGYKTLIIKSQILYHLKPMNKAVGVSYENYLKGYYDAYYRYLKIFVFIKFMKLLLIRPFIIGGLYYLKGYIKNILFDKSNYHDISVIKLLHTQQKRRLKNIIIGKPYSNI